MRFFKFIISFITVSSLFSVSAFAEIIVKVNDRTIAMDSSPYISKNSALVPIRFVSSALGCDVSWDSHEKKAEISNEDLKIILSFGSKTAYVNDKAKILTTAPTIRNNRLYVPLRFVSENMGAEVYWNETDKTALIYKDGINVNFPYSEDELYWLAKIINAEARGESHAGKVGVGNVVLNRVKSGYFPNTIYGVIFDRKNGVQFSPTADGAIYLKPTNASYYAAECALLGENYVSSSLYFCNPDKSSNTWIMRNRIFFTRIGTHNFYL